MLACMHVMWSNMPPAKLNWISALQIFNLSFRFRVLDIWREISKWNRIEILWEEAGNDEVGNWV